MKPEILQIWAAIIGGLAGGMGLLVTLGSLVFQQRRLVKTQQRDTYIRLEMASIDLFRFEAANATILKDYQPLVDPGQPRTYAGDIVVLNDYYQTLNLFEIIVRLTRAKQVDQDIFGSWVIWQHDLHCQWYFRSMWPQIRQNYTSDLKAIFDGPVGKFDPAQDEDARKRDFFEHVAAAMKMPDLAKWLDT